MAEEFGATYGVVVMMPAAHLEPGVVEAYAAPIPGLFDVGLAAGGVDAVAESFVAELGRAGFDTRAVPDVMRWKYTKLLMNLGNAVEAICVRDADAGELVKRARREARDVFDRAGIRYASAEEEAARRRPPAGARDRTGRIAVAGRRGSRSPAGSAPSRPTPSTARWCGSAPRSGWRHR